TKTRRARRARRSLGFVSFVFFGLRDDPSLRSASASAKATADKEALHRSKVLAYIRFMLPTFDDVASAARQISGAAHRTPVVTSTTIDARTGARIFFKCENLQRAGAFKFRGAYNSLSRLSADERRRGVVTFSSGNHAQAIALAGRVLEIPRVVVMPSD